MCTVTVVPHRTGVRIVCNRDERHERPIAEPPTLHTLGGLRAVWPVDPFSGGTWIGANEAGLALVLLNRNPRRSSAALERRLRSRGTIIPRLLRGISFDAVLAHAARLTPHRFEPFTLVVIQARAIATIQNSDGRIGIRRGRIARPLLFTSSSLGDHIAVLPRRSLFDRMVAESQTPLGGQAAFHRHRWATRPEISVWMHRADASTVSRTELEMSRTAASLKYIPLTGSRSSSRPGAISLPFLDDA